MRTGLCVVLGAWIFAAVPIYAQSPPAPVIPGQTSALPNFAQNPPPSELYTYPNGEPQVPNNFQFWVRAEYLAYWVKNTPVPVSLMTGDPNNPNKELLNSDRNLGLFSGFRIGFGVWFDVDNTLGLETTFFALQRNSRTFSASSDDNGSPALAFPFINQTPGAVGYTQMPIASPGVFAGSVSVVSTLSLWGAETNAAMVLMPRQGQNGIEITALTGFRYLNLRETLDINTLSTNIMTTPQTPLFMNDSFDTRNQFYGAQLGGRLSWQGERFGLDLTGKLAIGATHQTVDIQGYSTQTGPGGINGTFPGGFFTQPSNIGNYSANRFTVIPAVEMKFYVFITSRLRAFAGYDFIYWSQVARPGSQIDRNINLTQSVILGNGTLSGPASPTPLFNRTDFWAQGITLGLEFQF